MCTSEERIKISYKTSIIGIICNTLLFIFKLLVGILSNTQSIIADSFNNLSDSASVVISLVGTYFSKKPPDDEHPFGHGRVEYISAFIIAFLVLEVGIFIFINSVKKFFQIYVINIKPVFFLIIICSILLKIFMGFYYRHIAKKIDSDIFMATSIDAFNDCIITSATLVSMCTIKFFNIDIDKFIALIVSLLIIKNSINLVKETLSPIIGENIDFKLYDEIENFVKSYEGIIDVHDLIVHNYGVRSFMATIHAEVDKNDNIEHIHNIVDKIEKDINNKKNILLVIHIDPVDIKNEKTNNYKKELKKVIEELKKDTKYNKISFHDFKVNYENEDDIITCDVVIPFSMSKNDEIELKKKICKKVLDGKKNVKLDITFERWYC